MKVAIPRRCRPEHTRQRWFKITKGKKTMERILPESFKGSIK
jgi:hypothetical protein